MYTQLASEERYYIGIGLGNGDSIRQIAKDIGRSHTTVSREVARNTGKKEAIDTNRHRTKRRKDIRTKKRR